MTRHSTARDFAATPRRSRIIHELRHQLRYAPPEDQAHIRQQLDFWQRYR